MKEIKKYHERIGMIPGTLSELYYLDDANRLQGEYKRWHQNGQLYIQCFCEDDHRNGEDKIWNDRGQLLDHSHWSHGKLHGESKTWDNGGQLIEHHFYKNDENITDEVLPYIDNPVIIKLKFDIPVLA